MPAKTKKTVAKTKGGRKPRTSKQGYLMTRLEPDVAKDVRIERKRNGRTVQGEVNSVLRDAYASKWDVADRDYVAAGQGAPRLVVGNPNATFKFAP